MTAAEHLIRALFRATGGQPGHWRRITSMDTTERAIARAQRRGWIEVEGGHSIRLTESGFQKAQVARTSDEEGRAAGDRGGRFFYAPGWRCRWGVGTSNGS